MVRRNGVVPHDSEAAQEHFLAAAEACFERYGVAKTTMEDIAKEAGVSRPTVYRHFPDRDSLVMAVILRRARTIIGKTQAFIRKQKTFPDQLVEGMLFLINAGRNDPFVRMLVGPQPLELGQQLVWAQDAPADLTYEMWSPIFEAAIKRGELDPAIDLRAASRWLTYIEFVLIGRINIAPDEQEVRELLHSFLVPAFPSAAPTRTRRRATV